MADTPRIHNLYYPVGDMAQARRFYEALIHPPLQFADGERWVQYNLNGATFALSSRAEAAPNLKGGAITFEVGELDSFRDRIPSLGGSMIASRSMGSHGDALTIADPEGNIFHLWRRAPRPPQG
jgi:predicted enzyme related to lactoylglutathione lyase